MAAVLAEPSDQTAPVATLAPGFAQRYEVHVWRSLFGDILIEVRGDVVFVNGQEVVPAQQP